MNITVSHNDITAIASSEHRDPFAVLGMHEVNVDGKSAISVRAHFVETREAFVYVPDEDTLYPMDRVPNTGFFEKVFLAARNFSGINSKLSMNRDKNSVLTMSIPFCRS